MDRIAKNYQQTFKVIPKRGIRISWDDTTNFTQLRSLFKAKKQIIQSPTLTKDLMRRNAVVTVLFFFYDST